MGFTFKVQNKIPALKARLAKLDGAIVDVGFFEEDRYGAENSNLPVATVAAYNEFGTRFNPRRPFMATTFEDGVNQRMLGQKMSLIFKSVMKDGRSTRRLLRDIGDLASDLMKAQIITWPGRNSEATIAIKGRNAPLMDTEFMLRSVKFHIR